MSRRIMFAATLALGLAIVPTPAHAKGAIGATVTGPGLDRAIHLDMHDGAGTPLQSLAQSSGLYETMYAGEPRPLSPPNADLGPRYDAVYTHAGGFDVRQHLYPLARGGAVAYVPPGQPLAGGGKTVGGWFQGSGTSALKPLLVSLGMHASPSPAATGPAPKPRTGAAIPVTPVGAAGIALLGIVAIAGVRRRRDRVRRRLPEGAARGPS